MEARFGHDFADVRVHTGGEAARSAGGLCARAYPLGRHIAFSDGEYAPTSNAGRRLLAHELTHVVQQDRGLSSGVVQRAEVDDRSCAGLTDIEPDVDSKVNSEIAAARTSAGTPVAVAAFLQDVYVRLGKGIVSPIESFIEGLPASKRFLPPGDLAGTKYSGAGTANPAYLAQRLGGHVVGSAAKIHGICAGADKLGHFFDLGYLYWVASSQFGVTTAEEESIGRAQEIGGQGLGVGVPVGTGVYSRADQEANLAGWQFYKKLAADPRLSFAVKDYITPQWNEQVNPSYYETGIGAVVWSNLLNGRWLGEIAFASGTTKSAPYQLDLTATTTSVAGSYEWPAGGATPNRGKITGGKITQKTTTVSGQVPGDTPVSATAVTGISVAFDWTRGKSSGKGVLNSVDEQTLEGSWGSGSSRTGGGTLKLKKA